MSASSRRKDEHLAVVLGEDVASSVDAGFGRWRPRHRALPGIDLDDVDLAIGAFGRTVKAPLLISCMTGGSATTKRVNRNLAAAAESEGVMLGLGSLRAAVDDPGQLSSFAVREIAPSVPILANTGTFGVDIGRLVDTCRSLEVDALAVHLNPLQEALQPDGEAAFGAALDTVRELVEASPVPVIAKEVGFGLDADDVRSLLQAGCVGVDVAGAGGTNWALVEGFRSGGVPEVAAAFSGWGTPTAEALLDADRVRRTLAPGALVVASGGIRDGVTALVALCLGADIVGVGGGWIRAATESADAAASAVRTVSRQLRIAAFAVGAMSADDLDRSRLRDLAAASDPGH